MGPGDLEVTLALVRGGTLAAAGERLGVDTSTVFRSLQRLERGLGRPLHPESRNLRRVGMVYTHLAQVMNTP